MTELCDLARKWTTDKALYYTPLYDSLLRDRRDSVRKVLEFGIGYPELMMQPASRMGARYYIAGASLFMWEEYFPNAEIYALDNRVGVLINSGRIHSFFCDQGSENSYFDVMEDLGENFDLIIDDGSHIRDHQILCAQMLVPLLAPDGIYIMEDAPVGDGEFVSELQYQLAPAIGPAPWCEVHDFNENPKDPARVIVIRR
jgi:hypothetical protein